MARREGFTRRTALQRGSAAAALLPFGLLDDLGLRLDRPPGFPADVPLARRPYENWATTIRCDGLWTCRPRTAAEVVRVVNWAHGAGWTVRPRGAMHGWSPLVVTADTTRSTRTVLLDLGELRRVEVLGARGAVRAGAGATLLTVHEALQAHGLGLASFPATGDPTVGGALAIGAHGAVVPAAGESPAPGHGFGSLSNLVLELTAVAWDPAAGRYVLRTFRRDEADTSALLVHLGRACVVDVVLRAGPAVRMRCQSITDVPARELFAAPGSPGRTFERFLDDSGRVEAIWFPFTERPWLKVWSIAPTKPAASRAVGSPYNYPFSDTIPLPVARLADLLVTGLAASTPTFGALQYEVSRAGLAATASGDLWGWGKDVQLYIRASTLRVDELGYGVLCARADVQRVLHLLTTEHERRLDAARAQGRFPINSAVELRCCSVDRADDAGVPGARVPALAATAPRTDRPEWDTVVWVNVLTLPGTAGSNGFYRGLERWMHATFDGTWATLRPEWSKGFAFTATAPCADPEMLDTVLPGLVSAGRPQDEGFSWAQERLSALDPHGVLDNPFLRRWR